jgi:hypothetical protein
LPLEIRDKNTLKSLLNCSIEREKGEEDDPFWAA